MTAYTFSMENQPSRADIQTLIRNLVSYNDTQAEKENWRSLAIFIRNARGEIMGGLSGYTHWGWLFIGHLWVAEMLRGQRYGTKLIAKAEQEAANRGCRHTHVDTFDFQARGFYQKQGYELFGSLQDFPTDHTRYFLQKRLPYHVIE